MTLKRAIELITAPYGWMKVNLVKYANCTCNNCSTCAHKYLLGWAEMEEHYKLSHLDRVYISSVAEQFKAGYFDELEVETDNFFIARGIM